MDIPVEIARRLERHPEVSFALLFGSRAGGSPRPDSDWDVAVYFDPPLSSQARFAHRRELVSDLADLGRIDLVVLNEAPPLLAHRALQGRRLVHRDPAAYVRFFVRTLGESGDERHWRELDHQARLRRLAEGRFGRP